MAIRIPIISDFDSKGLDRAVRQFEQLKTTGEKAQFGLEKAAGPAGVALVGLAAAAAKPTSATPAGPAAFSKPNCAFSPVVFSCSNWRTARSRPLLSKSLIIGMRIAITSPNFYLLVALNLLLLWSYLALRLCRVFRSRAT